MAESIIISEQVKWQFSARATLVAVGVKVRSKGIFDPVAEIVHIIQKACKYTPVEKLLDAYINIFAGAH